MNNKIISMLDALDYSELRQFPERSSLWLLNTWYNLRGLVQLVDSPIVPHLDFENAVWSVCYRLVLMKQTSVTKFYRIFTC